MLPPGVFPWDNFMLSPHGVYSKTDDVEGAQEGTEGKMHALKYS